MKSLVHWPVKQLARTRDAMELTMATLNEQTLRDQAASLTFSTRAIINGKAVDALSGATFATENPATGQTLTHISECNEADVDVAVTSAREAFERGDWSRRHPAERRRTMLKFADLIESPHP